MKEIHIWLAAFFFIIFLLVTFFIGLDNDAWFLLNHGRYVANFGIPHTEPFTIHENFHFIMQQWLFALGLWQVYHLGGMMGIFIATGVAGACLLTAYYKLVQEIDRGHIRLSAEMTAVVGLLVVLIFLRQRPQVASSFIFLLEIILLERYGKRHTPPWWLYIGFFVMSLLLINLHAAMWPMLLVFMLPYLAEVLVAERFSWCQREFCWSYKPIILLMIIILVAGFCNPYGYEAMLYTYHSYGNAEINATVLEMRPMSLEHGASGVGLFLLFLLTAVYARHRIPLRYLLLVIGTGYMAASSLRSLFLFLLFGTLPLAYILRDWKPVDKNITWRQFCFQVIGLGLTIVFSTIYVLSNNHTENGKYLPFELITGGILVIFLLRCLYRAFEKRHQQESIVNNRNKAIGLMLAIYCLVVFGTTGFKVSTVSPELEKAIDVLLTYNDSADISLWTGYNDGNYAEFRGVRCYLDARAEVFLPAMNQQKDVFDEYLKLQRGTLDYREFATRYKFTHFLTRGETLLYTYLENDPDYVLIWNSEKDDDSEVNSVSDEKRIRLYAYKPNLKTDDGTKDAQAK